ncbi:hypothetical protein [Cupriavidus sp. AcVe19-1a]|uniref:hypothetical protein n=1 Tax=Cupriavidus sp. AcVe19-1a TaxID=2821359 RepID=UPI001FD7E3EB|nr:hypothetical protein [Cupriavidus sp. AcVe19-1a]
MPQQPIAPPSRRRIAAELFRAIWRFRLRVVVAVSLLLLLAKACAVAVPLLLKLVVDEVTPAAARLGLVTMPVFLGLGQQASVSES